MTGTPERITVRAEHAYDVLIGRGLGIRAGDLLPDAGRIAVIHPAPLADRALAVAADLRDSGCHAILLEVPDAEQAKTPQVLADCWDALGTAGFTRSDAVVSVGGGATTDLAGFVAATWMRGIRVVHIPTTLLAMVDAAVGGKTGINAAAGKNLIGSFHSPAGVVCDLDALMTLPRADLAAGMAEVVKVGFTSDPTILDDVRADAQAALDPSGPLLADLVRRAVQVKADVVSQDFREESATSGSGRIGREVLNYGHTFGHAVEQVQDYRWRHGDAVSVGLVYVAELARIGGYLADAEADLHREVLGLIGLPTAYPARDWDRLLAAMAVDKKARGGTLRFVVLEGIGRPVNWNGPQAGVLRAAFEAVSRP
ncbi:MAG: 3-dehydroquinate synthase [Actinomycetales bacterium]|nr:3-dehydroquinate synthase [Actinomycetales bacterium]